MTMSSGNEIGISPALLQAITQTISMKNRPDGDAGQNGTASGDGEKFVISRDPNYQQIIKVESSKGHSLEGLSEALSAMGQQAFQAGNTILVVQNPEMELTQGGISEEQVYTEVREEQVVESVDHNPVIVTPQVLQSIETTSNLPCLPGGETVVSLARDYAGLTQNTVTVTSQNMNSVMSAIASQISEQVSGGGGGGMYRVVPQPLVQGAASLTDIKPAFSTVHSIKPQSSLLSSSSSFPSSQSILLTPSIKRVIPTSLVANMSHSVPSPTTTREVIVSGDNVLTETVVQTSDAQTISNDVENEAPKKLRIVEVNELGEGFDSGTTIILNPGDMRDGSVLKTITAEEGAIVYRAAQASPDPNSSVPIEFQGGCPICGDKVSGYHYGIYSCESCKGFFKRTVQNKKAFICHRMGECMVSMANRKKCPACRFKRCLIVGMKLEAIREDRMRGGRSSYDGCSPHKPIKMPKEKKQQASPQSRPNVIVSPIMIQTPSGPITIPCHPDALSSPELAGIPSTSETPVNPGKRSPSDLTPIAPRPIDLNQIQPQTPQLLEDLMAVESLMLEDEEEQSCCEGKLVEADPNKFASLLHFADHCLYKIVRWARNLPDFANVSTDDQIILLQNCWAELLCLCCCWKSIRSAPDVLKLSHGRILNKEQAAVLGIGDEIQRMLDFTDSLRGLETDNYEFVAIKALLLFSPDVKNLKDKNIVRRYQDRITESLMIYTTTNSPNKASKFCELLACIPELTRACVVGKDQLNQRQVSGQVPQYSLLSELLKGDVSVG